jgi:hypothetical protein
LAEKVNDLSEVTKTLRRYLEGLIGQFAPGEGEKIVAEESERLERVELMSRLKDNHLVFSIIKSEKGLERLVALLRKAGSLQELGMLIEREMDVSGEDSDLNLMRLYAYMHEPGYHTLAYLNHARKTLGLKPYETPKAGDEEAQTAPEETSTARRGKVGGANRSERKST